MKKSIELKPQTIKALLKGATMFALPIGNIEETYSLTKVTKTNVHGKYEDDKFLKKFKQPIKNFILQESPLQKGVQFFVKEDFLLTPNCKLTKITYKNDWGKKAIKSATNTNWIKASQMTEEQSRLKNFITVNVKVKRIEDIDMDERIKIVPQDLKCGEDGVEIDEWIADTIDDENGFGTYESNPYVFLYTIEKK